VPEGQGRYRGDHEQGQVQSDPARQRHRGDHDRRQEKHRKGIFDPSGQIEKNRQLEDIVSQHQCGRHILQPFDAAEAQPQADVEPGRSRDDKKTRAKRKRKPEPEIGNDERDSLSEQSQPAQCDERIDAEPPRAPA
jgi:hypothetical protein